MMKILGSFINTVFVVLYMTIGAASAQQQSAVVIYDNKIPAVQFAASDLTNALQQKGYIVTTANLADTSKHVGLNQFFLIDKDANISDKPFVAVDLKKEGFAIKKQQRGNNQQLWVIGNDMSGLTPQIHTR